MSDYGFWIGLAIGVVLGFGGGLVLFLPIVWKQVDLEDALDKRKSELKRMTQAIERIRDGLDEITVRKDGDLFRFLTGDNGLNSNLKDLAANKMPRKMENYGRR
jgi:hypothetical protein